MTYKFTRQILSTRSKSLQSYFNEINKIPLLTADEETQLTKKIQEGDLDALERLTKANLRFVISVAKQYQQHTSSLTVEDLINEGNLGLLKAAQRFDETKGFKFISYAVWWIRQSIIKAIYEESRMVRMPVNKISNLSKIKKAFIQLEQKFEREPCNDELAEVIDLEKNEINDIRKHESSHISLDAPAVGADDEQGANLLNFMEQNGFKIEMDLQDQSLQTDLERVISSLTERQQLVTKLYFGIGNQRPYNLEEIGDRLGMSRERVRQLKEIALKKLRKNGRATLLKKYL